jgi:NAD(P)-dependent dehydrogenase (short-subunit alcohol dehydrogenase family)
MAIPYTRSSQGPVAGRLTAKVVAVIGISGGQGQAAALLFARSGAIVVGCDRFQILPCRLRIADIR